MLYRKLFLLFLLLLTVGISVYEGCFDQSGKTSLAGRPIDDGPLNGYVIPFIPLKGHGIPVVRVRLNNKVDANFILDTGTNSTFITEQLAEKLHLPTLRQSLTMNKAKEPADVDSVDIRKFHIGGADGIDTQCEVFILEDNFRLTALSPNGDFDGILGTDILGRFAVVLDFEKNQVSFLNKGNLDNDQLAALGINSGVSTGIPLTGDKGDNNEHPQYIAPVCVGASGKYQLLIDTGSSDTVVSDPKKKILMASQGITATAATLNENWEYPVFPVGSFGAGETLSSAKRNRLSPFVCGVAQDAPQIVPVLGLNYLAYFRVILDGPAHRLYLNPVSNPTHLLFPTETSRQSAQTKIAEDLVIVPSAEGKWFVVSTLADGLYGKAGVKAGDRIVEVNGKKPDGEWAGDIFSNFLRSESKVSLQLLRKDKVVHVEVKRK